MDYFWVIIWMYKLWAEMLPLIWKIEHEFIPGADMYSFFEKGVRSRVSYISKKYIKASNRCLTSYEPNKS